MLDIKARDQKTLSILRCQGSRPSSLSGRSPIPESPALDRRCGISCGIVQLSNDAIVLRVDLSLIRRGEVAQGRKFAGRGLGQQEVKRRVHRKLALDRHPHTKFKLGRLPGRTGGEGLVRLLTLVHCVFIVYSSVLVLFSDFSARF